VLGAEVKYTCLDYCSCFKQESRVAVRLLASLDRRVALSGTANRCRC